VVATVAIARTGIASTPSTAKATHSRRVWLDRLGMSFHRIWLQKGHEILGAASCGGIPKPR